MTFKSKIGYSLLGLIGANILALSVLCGLKYLINEFRLHDFDWNFLILIVPYTFGIYFYIGLFNNDIKIDNTKIEIINRVPFFKKKISFNYSNIKTITLRHDWTETFGKNIKSKRIKFIFSQLTPLLFPYNYKWIKIETDNEYKFYCFGIDYDYYDNECPSFEDIYNTLSENINLSNGQMKQSLRVLDLLKCRKRN